MGRATSDRAIDYELWRRACVVLGQPRAVTLWTCPACGEETLVWPGTEDAGCECLNRKCGLAYQDFRELVEDAETYLAAKRERKEREIKQLMSHDSYKRVHGRIRQVRHA